MSANSKTRFIGRLGLLFALAIVAGTLAYTSIASSATKDESSTRDSAGTSSSALPQAADDFNISSFGWEKPSSEPGEPILTVTPAQDERLTTCGSDAWEGSILALAPRGAAYCIEPVDMSNPEAVHEARVVAMQLIEGGTFTDAELGVLRLQMLLGYATPESAAASQYRDELNKAWEDLTPVEQEHLLG